MIVDAVEHLRAYRSKPWLVLGKGPSSDFACRHDLAAYHVMALNHACRLHRPDVAHFTDLEAYFACRDDVREVLLCMPWYPHVHMKPGPKPLSEALATGHRTVLAYNSSVARTRPKNPRLRTVRVRYFSAVAAFNLLALSGIKVIHTLGVDGGTGYGSAFDTRDRLANGRPSFDCQFAEIRYTCRAMKVEHVPLGERP